MTESSLIIASIAALCSVFLSQTWGRRSLECLNPIPQVWVNWWLPEYILPFVRRQWVSLFLLLRTIIEKVVSNDVCDPLRLSILHKDFFLDALGRSPASFQWLVFGFWVYPCNVFPGAMAFIGVWLGAAEAPPFLRRPWCGLSSVRWVLSLPWLWVLEEVVPSTSLERMVNPYAKTPALLSCGQVRLCIYHMWLESNQLSGQGHATLPRPWVFLWELYLRQPWGARAKPYSTSWMMPPLYSSKSPWYLFPAQVIILETGGGLTPFGELTL